MKLTLAELNEIDLKQLGSAPLAVRVFVIIFACIVLLSAGVYLDTSQAYKKFDRAQQKELSLKQEYKVKAAKAAQLDQYKAQLKIMRHTLNTLLEQLPSETEIPQLIVDVSQTALANGLKIDLFKPQQEIAQGFYAEKPIELVMQGSFHQFAMFASDIAALPRIVTLHDIHLTHNDTQMSMQAIAKTYRYLNSDHKDDPE
jgi:type IV pilus assembly protein PilO